MTDRATEKVNKMERKTKFVFNEDGSYDYVPVRGFKMSDDDRLKIVQSFVEGEMTSAEIVERYELSSKNVLFNWICKFMDEKELVALWTNKTGTMSQSTINQSNDIPSEADKDAQILQLQQALRLEKLKSEGYSTMIDLAEREFNIQIRKKCGTKQ